jgi:tetratricopeptide (TPR) repeat protein
MSSQEDIPKSRGAAGLMRTVSAGLAHHQAGRLDRAEALYRHALKKDPNHADALHLLGVIAYQCGEIEPALQLIERALPGLAQLPDAHLNHGNALRAAGRLVEAIKSYRRAVALDPDHGMAHCNLAGALNERGAFEAGLESSRRAVALLPDFPGALIHQAAALKGLERFAEAEPVLRRVLELMPERAETYRELGLDLSRLGQFDEAVTLHQRSIELDPTDATMHSALGITFYHMEDLAGSEIHFRHALALDPDNAPAWQGLGIVKLTWGRLDEAQCCFCRTLELDPDLWEAQLNLAAMRSKAGDQARICHLQALLKDSDRPTTQRIPAGFALGVLLDNADRYDEAFPCFAQANALYRQLRADAGERFDPQRSRRDVDGLIATATPELFSISPSWGNPSEAPVFIVGMPRCGTSLVEQIAASHSQVFGAGERKDIDRIFQELLIHNPGKQIERWDATFARQLADQHVARLGALGAGAARVIDKMVDNVFALWLVAALFPSARVILCQRDLRDVCLSCYFHKFRGGHLYSYDLAECGRRALDVERLATHWLRVLPLKMLMIDYEELIEDPEGESRRLIEFLGLEWEPACLDFHRTERAVFTASSWQVRQPLFKRSVGRWRHYARHLEPLLQVLTPDENDTHHGEPDPATDSASNGS